MEDNKYWLCFWGIVAVAFSVLVVATSQYHMHKNEVRAQMVRDGMSPLMVNCVIEDELNEKAKCIILALKESEANMR